MAKTEIPVNLATLSHMAQGAELWNCTQVPSDSGDAEVQIASVPTVRRYLDANGNDMYGYMHAGYDSLIDCQQVFEWLVILGETATGEGTDAGVKRMVKAIKVSGDGSGPSSEIRFVPYVEKLSGTTAPFKTFPFIDKNAVKWVVILTYHSSQGQGRSVEGMPDGIRAFAFRADSQFKTWKEWIEETPEKIEVDGTVTPAVFAPVHEYTETERFIINSWETSAVAPIDFIYADRPDALYDIFIRSQFYEAYENLDVSVIDPEGTLDISAYMPTFNSTGQIPYSNLTQLNKKLGGVVPLLTDNLGISLDYMLMIKGTGSNVSLAPSLFAMPRGGFTGSIEWRTEAFRSSTTYYVAPNHPQVNSSQVPRFYFFGGTTFWYQANQVIDLKDDLYYTQVLTTAEKNTFMQGLISSFRNYSYAPPADELYSYVDSFYKSSDYNTRFLRSYQVAMSDPYLNMPRFIMNTTKTQSGALQNTWFYMLGELAHYVRLISTSGMAAATSLAVDTSAVPMSSKGQPMPRIPAMVNNISTFATNKTISYENRLAYPYFFAYAAGTYAYRAWNANKTYTGILLLRSTPTIYWSNSTSGENMIDAWVNGTTLTKYPASVQLSSSAAPSVSETFLDGVSTSAMYSLNYGIDTIVQRSADEINNIHSITNFNNNSLWNDTSLPQVLISVTPTAGNPSNIEQWYVNNLGLSDSTQTAGWLFVGTQLKPIPGDMYNNISSWLNTCASQLSRITSSAITGITAIRSTINAIVTSPEYADYYENLKSAIDELRAALRVSGVFSWKGKQYSINQPVFILQSLAASLTNLIAGNSFVRVNNVELLPKTDSELTIPSTANNALKDAIYATAGVGRIYAMGRYIINTLLMPKPGDLASNLVNNPKYGGMTWLNSVNAMSVSDLEAALDYNLNHSSDLYFNLNLGDVPRVLSETMTIYESVFPIGIAYEWIKRKVAVVRDIIKNYRNNVQFYDLDSLSHRLLLVADDDRFYYSGPGDRICTELNFYTPEYSNSSSTSVNVLGNRIVLGTSNSIEFWDITNNSNDPFSPAYASNVYNMQMLQWSECRFDDKLYFLARPNEGTNYSYYCVDKTGKMEKISYPTLDAWTSYYINVSLATYNPPKVNTNRYLKAASFQYESCPFICWQFNNPSMQVSSTNEEIIGQCLCYNVLYKTWFTLPTMLFRANLESGLTEHPLVFFERFTNRIGTLTNYIDNTDKLFFSYFTIPNSNFKEYITEKNRHKSLARVSVDLDLHNRSVVNQRTATFAPIDTLKPVPPAVGGHTDQKADVWGTSGPYYKDNSKIGPLQEWNTPLPYDVWQAVLAPAGSYQSIKHKLRSVKKLPYETTREIILAPMQGERNVIYSIEGLTESVDVSLRTEWNGYTRFNGFFYELE